MLPAFRPTGSIAQAASAGRSVTLAIPTPPSINHAWANKSRGRTRTKAYEAWIEEAGWRVNLQHPGHIGGRVEIEIGISRIVNADVDNRIKATLDLLTKMGVIDDDKHVEKVSAEWRDDIVGAVVVVRAA